MGGPKASISFAGKTCAQRGAGALLAVAERVVVGGPEFRTGLEVVDDPREGPLVAFVCGAEALVPDGPVFLVACDVPFVSAEVLGFIASRLGDFDAVLPVVAGRDQPSISLFAPQAI